MFVYTFYTYTTPVYSCKVWHISTQTYTHKHKGRFPRLPTPARLQDHNSWLMSHTYSLLSEKELHYFRKQGNGLPWSYSLKSNQPAGVTKIPCSIDQLSNFRYTPRGGEGKSTRVIHGWRPHANLQLIEGQCLVRQQSSSVWPSTNNDFFKSLHIMKQGIHKWDTKLLK